MPIYEFYCVDCHTVFSFFARTINSSKRPTCPRCGNPELEKRMSRFAISKGATEGDLEADGPMSPDDARIERALEELAAEHDHMDHDDPHHAIPMIQKVYEIAGMPIPEKAQEVIRRIKAGEDPETLNEEFGDLWEMEDSPFMEGGPLHQHLGALVAPRVDHTLYDL
jgi:putative FmdB family regulatory protein